ncbi:MAG: DNA alkylation repair protein [Candidatus Nanopelagicales bacterium]
MLDTAAWALGVRDRLAEQGDRHRAEFERAYLKSSRPHLGVRVPLVRATVREALRDSGPRGVPERDLALRLAAALWSLPEYECHLAAVEVLVRGRRRLSLDDLPAVEGYLREAGTWALVDPLAVEVVGDVVARADASGDAGTATQVLDSWAVDRDFWVRRTALLAHLRPLRQGGGDPDRFLRYADAMLEEREFFVRKAIGWVLRETGRRRPELVADWLRPRAARCSGVTMREAVKPLPPEVREELLAVRRR